MSWAQSVDQYRDSVLEELEWLLNTTRTTIEVPADRYPEVARSVLLYGMPDVASLSADSTRDRKRLTRSVKEAIELFEPRLKDPKVNLVDAPDESVLSIHLSIEGDLCMDPSPERLVVDTVLEISSGRINVGDPDAR